MIKEGIAMEDNGAEVYDLLNEMFETKSNGVNPNRFTDEIRKAILSEDDKKIYDLLRKISSITIKYKKDSVEFVSSWKLYPEEKYFSVDDLDESEYLALQSMNYVQLPKLLCVLVTEILWKYKKDFKVVDPMLGAYYGLYMEKKDTSKWLIALKYIKRAIIMSAKTRKNEKNQYYKNMLFEQIKISDKINRDLFAFEGIDFLINQGWNKMEDFVPMLDSVIEMQPNKIRKVERAYELKKKIYIKMNKKKKEIMSVNNTLADYYIQKAKELDEKNIQSIFNKEEYLKRAIELYRNNGKPDRAKDLMKELLMVQKEMSKFMSPIFITFDKSEIEERFENLDFKESIKQLILYVSFYKIEDIKKSVLERVNDPLENAFGEIRNKNEKGNTLVNILPLDKNDPEKDTELLYKHMYHELSIFAEINGNVLKIIIELFNTIYDFEKDDLRFLVENNAIIPDGRKDIFLEAIYFGLKGENYLALHILAPQMENLFRYIAECAGGNMITLEANWKMQERTGNAIFDDSRLRECYDKDILFLFKGLMIEETGANIRNKIAHGIMNVKEAENGKSTFFICAVIKLLFCTQRNTSVEILRE